jgi:hypothetical protein
VGSGGPPAAAAGVASNAAAISAIRVAFMGAILSWRPRPMRRVPGSLE